MMTSMSPDRLQSYLLRHDFSRWLRDVFRDRSLSQRVWEIEAERWTPDAAAAIVQAIRARYDTAPGACLDDPGPPDAPLNG